MRRSTQQLGISLLVVLTFACAFVWLLVLSSAPSGVLTVSFLDVGQGDAIFIETPNKIQVLVDAGKGAGVLRELGTAMYMVDRSIDVVVATHPDLDHIGGLPSVFSRYNVGLFLEPGVLDEGSDYTALIASVTEAKVHTQFARAGERLELDTGVYMDVMFPDRDAARMNANDASVVLRLVYGDTSFLLTGDAPVKIEHYLVGQYAEGLQSNVLKLGHHGSRTSTSDEWLGFVAPDYAVVSAGCDNSYGHPHTEVLERLTAFEVHVLSTCKEGTVTFESDGQLVQKK